MMVKKADEPGLEDVEQFVVDVTTTGKDVYVGIDPGARGAIAFLCGKTYCVVSVPVVEMSRTRRVNVPEEQREKGGPKTRVVHGKTSKFNLHEILRVFKALRSLKERVYAVVEIASPMVGKKKGAQNTRTAFMTGMGYYMWPLFLLSKGYAAIDEVEPENWKAEFKLLKKDKSASLQKARSLFPKAPLSRAKDDGRAEALLLAEYFRRKRGQT